MNLSSVHLDEVVALLGRCGLPITERLTLPGRKAVTLPVPDVLRSDLAEELQRRFPHGLYSHQTRAIQAVLEGHDVCLATSTSSGKSLVFITAAADITCRDPSSKVLALYPAKALIQDQLAKWQEFLDPLHVRVGFIDGSVLMSKRTEILRSCRVIAMTPDVAHAWVMSHVGDTEIDDFLGHLRLLILDEAHVYDGAFGTNMAYFLRRLSVAAQAHRIVCSTATVGAPRTFMHHLTGREFVILDSDADGSEMAEKNLLLAPVAAKGGFDRTVRLLAGLATYGKARFLAFADSRKAVERLVAAILRHTKESAEEDEVDYAEDEDLKRWPRLENVLPFRAGYESADRGTIQKALTQGKLAGVISTSALELGLDIGHIDVAVLLNTPSSTKAFRQRIGRAGRQHAAVCILLDDLGTMAPLSDYVRRQPEPSWLYLENRYIQYSNALCAAVELQARGVRSARDLHFNGLPESFTRLVENELNPTEAVPTDLYSIQQKAQGNPHSEFPIRSAAEPNFTVKGPFDIKLGTLSYAQALREAYPGAVYYYMARPFRVLGLEFKKGRIKAGRSKYFTTKPITDNMAFPDFKNGVLSSWKSEAGFLTEVELQVSVRVRGFTEQRGQSITPHEYGPDSSYSHTPLTRFFRTTGVCWAFPGEISKSEAVAQCILEAFCFTCGVQERDLGIALFHANEGPFSPTPVKGVVIFDATNGSLRLTERLAARFNDVLTAAIKHADDADAPKDELVALRLLVGALKRQSATKAVGQVANEGDWVDVIARNEPAMYLHVNGPIEVTILDYRYTPHGLMYGLKNLREAGYALETGKGGVITGVSKIAEPKWMVMASVVQPIHGKTRMTRANFVTGEHESDITAPVPK